ncbi:MAG: DUF3887 domain-containing protein [Mobilitalea sp.]
MRYLIKKVLIMVISISMLMSFTGCKKEVTDTSNNQNNSGQDSALQEEADEEEELNDLSEKLALQMTEGDFEDIYSQCSVIMKTQITKKALEEAWDTTVKDIGSYVEVYKISQKKVETFQQVTVVLKFEKSGLSILFTYNSSNKLEGLWFNYYPLEEAAVTTETYKEVKVTIGEGDFPISAILTLPNGVENPPVAILVPGSGNHDMNETVMVNKPFQDIAWGLSEQGIASIRYDERMFSYPELLNNTFTIEADSLTDTKEVIKYATSCEFIDPKKIYVIGHSLGAMMAPKIATDNKEVIGIILLAGSPRRLEDIIYDQAVVEVDKTDSLTKEEKESQLDTVRTSIQKVKAIAKEDVDSYLGYPASYWYRLNQIDTAELAKNLTIPIFIAQGTKDVQIYADKDYIAWQELLAGKENISFHLYENLNHLFMTSTTGDVSEYSTKGNVNQNVIDDIAEWMKK